MNLQGERWYKELLMKRMLGRLWLLVALVLGSCSTSDGGLNQAGPQVHVTVTGVSAEVSLLRTAVVFNGTPSKESRDLMENLAEFTILLPEGARGKLIVTLSALAADRCVVAAANKELDITADGRVELPLALSGQAKSCSLTIQRSGDGMGSVISNPAGLDCGAKCTFSFPFGTRVKLTATTDMGQFFAGWSSGGCSGTNDCSLVLSAPTEVSAAFTGNSLTVRRAGTGVVVSVPPGINCGGNGTGCVTGLPMGNKVRLLARADLPNCFTGWSGACTGTGTCEVTGAGSAQVVANFATCQQKPVTVNTYNQGSDYFVSIYGIDGILFALSSLHYYNYYEGPNFSYSYIGGNSSSPIFPIGSWGASKDLFWVFGKQYINNSPLIKIANKSASYVSGTEGLVLNAMWGSSGQNVWAVGEKVILHSDGIAWSKSPRMEVLQGVWGSSASDIWAAGTNATLLHFDGAQWTPVMTGLPSNADLRQVFGTASDDVWVTTSIAGTVLRFDGKVWASIPVPFDNIGVLGSGAATGNTDIWFASMRGAPGAIVHWNGATWSKLETVAGGWISTYGASPSDIWFANNSVKTMANPTPNQLLHLTP